jgi:hypothetical protein
MTAVRDRDGCLTESGQQSWAVSKSLKMSLLSSWPGFVPATHVLLAWM